MAQAKGQEENARLLDASGTLQAGVKVCPPEEDAGTGMTATNSVAVRTGNISAGISVFAMEGFNVFIERYLKGLPIERAAVENL